MKKLFALSIAAIVVTSSIPILSSSGLFSRPGGGTYDMINQSGHTTPAPDFGSRAEKVYGITVVVKHEYSFQNDCIEYCLGHLGNLVELRDLTASLYETLKKEPQKHAHAFLNFHRILSLSFQDWLSMIAAEENLSQCEFVESTDREGATLIPNYTSANDPKRSDQTGLDIIQAPYAWDYSTGSSSVKIGIIDSGCDVGHSDLSPNISSSLGYDFYNHTSSMNDGGYHGTFMAGVIGARGNNSNGIAGINWFVNLVPLKVHYKEWFWFQWLDKWSPSAAIEALAYSESNQIPIINFSLSIDTNHTSLKAAIANYGGLFVCSAGNKNQNLNSQPDYPSSWVLPNMVSVGASTDDDSKCSFSNYGSSVVHLFAPGNDVVSTCPTSYDSNGWTTESGTSCAAPFVAGAAALLRGYHSGMNTQSMKATILNNTDYSSSLSSYCSSQGRLNIYKAMQYPNHIHSYDDHYSYSTALKHRSYCLCGQSILEPHVYDFNGSWMSGSTEYGNCAFCNHSFPLGARNA